MSINPSKHSSMVVFLLLSLIAADSATTLWWRKLKLRHHPLVALTEIKTTRLFTLLNIQARDPINYQNVFTNSPNYKWTH